MRIFISLLMLMSLLGIIYGAASKVLAGEVRQGDTVTIATPGIEARLCPQPMCKPDQHITRIPQGTVLKIENMLDAKIGSFKVRWFEVTYQDNRGWISIFDTDKARND
jgi:hypothetical protein